MKLGMSPIEADADIEQFLNGLCEGEDTFGVDGALRFGHFACVLCGERAGDGFLIGKELVEGSGGNAGLGSNRIGGGLMVAKAAEDRSGGAEQIPLALLTSSIAPAIGIKDSHRVIFAEGVRTSKNLHPDRKYKYLLA